ncbi:hypothetical protein HKCCE3408_01510 [Rhodobacterales bacterium HKCCE3408]|nr:hypothetical protein [Rhodobacterales bacterium HKCCE3408]
MLAALASLDGIQMVSALVKALTYVSVLVAAGSVLVLVAIPEFDEPAQRTLRRAAVATALIGILFTAARLPVRAAFLWGGADGATDPAMLGIVADSPLGTAAVWRVPALVAICAAAFDRPWARAVACLGVLLVAGTFAMRGHAVGEPRTGLAVLYSVHVLAAGFWIGAFLPLQSMALRDPVAAAPAAERFAKMALWAVAALIAAGVAILFLLTGDPLAALETPWGRFLTAKIALVAGLLGLAALNKLRLTPLMRRTADGRALARSIRWEMAVAGLILLATAALTTVASPEHAGM